jgi:PAS domain S-box-containing protein
MIPTRPDHHGSNTESPRDLNVSLLELSRLVNSTSIMEDIQHDFGKIACALIGADRVALAIHDKDLGSNQNVLVYGHKIDGYETNSPGKPNDFDSFPWLNTHTPFIIDDALKAQLVSTTHSEQAVIQAGLNSALVAPIVWHTEQIAVLTFRATKKDAFGSDQIEIATAIADQVAGAIANHVALQKSITESNNRELLAQIGRTISSSEDVSEIFDRLAELIGQMVPYDRFAFIEQNAEIQAGAALYSHGRELNWAIDGQVPEGRQITELLNRSRQTTIVDSRTPNIATDLAISDAMSKPVGLLSWMVTPLFWKNQLIGTMHFRSATVDVYTPTDAARADEIATQVTGIVAGSIALNELAAVAKERANLAAIGRSITSSQFQEQTYRQFAKSAAELIPWDRISIATIPTDSTINGFVFEAGIKYPDDQNNRLPRLRSELSVIFASDNSPKIVDERFTANHPNLQIANKIANSAGLNSWLLLPLNWRNRQVGYIHFRSLEENAYNDSHIRLATLISNQISGAIAGNLAYQDLERESLAKDVLAQISRIVGTTRNFADALPEVEKIALTAIDFTGITIGGYDDENETISQLHLHDLQVRKDYLGLVFPAAETVSGRALKAKEIQSVSYSSMEQLADHPRSASAFEAGSRTFLTAPLTSGDRVIGGLQIRSDQENAFSHSDIEFVGRIADQITGSFASSLAHEQIQLQAAALESADNAIVITTTEGVIEWINNAFTRLTGWTSKEAIGQTTKILRSSDPDNWNEDEEIWGALRSGNSWSGTHISRKKDGTEFPEDLTVTPVKNSQNEITHLIGIKQDVTERLRADEQIKLQAAALESADNAIVIISPIGIVEWVNQAFTQEHGWSQDEIIGQPTSLMRSSSPDEEALSGEIWKILNRGESWSGIHTNRKKDGSENPEEATVTPVFDQNGQITHFIAIKKDITERLAAEETLNNSIRVESQNRELQRLAISRSEFLSTVSHELRTPLTTVSAFADILSHNRTANLSQTQLAHIGLIRKSSAHLATLIDDLLDISQADSGRIVMNKQDFNLAEMIEEVVSARKVVFNQLEQSLEYSNFDRTLNLFADRSRVIQILTNLLNNASKYSESGSAIRLEVERVDGSAVFTVSDEGSGISTKDQASMFTPFFRGANENTMQAAGAGLGLSIVQSLVTLHDGRISIESKLRIGTSVTITLPGVSSSAIEKKSQQPAP